MNIPPEIKALETEANRLRGIVADVEAQAATAEGHRCAAELDHAQAVAAALADGKALPPRPKSLAEITALDESLDAAIPALRERADRAAGEHLTAMMTWALSESRAMQAADAEAARDAAGRMVSALADLVKRWGVDWTRQATVDALALLAPLDRRADRAHAGLRDAVSSVSRQLPVDVDPTGSRRDAGFPTLDDVATLARKELI